jgi:hypothetical protein
MKNGFFRAAMAGLALTLVSCNFAFGQGGTVRTQNTWTRPFLTLNGNVVQPGATLLPDTKYGVVLEALPPIATDNTGQPILGVLYIQDGDGFVGSSGSGIAFGADVPLPAGTDKRYQRTIYITTNSAADLPPQIYVRYRGITYENDAVTNFTVGTPTVRIQQALVP